MNATPEYLEETITEGPTTPEAPTTTSTTTTVDLTENAWTLLIRQTAGTYLPASEWQNVNSDDPSNPNYSILDRLGDSCKDDQGKFEFRLVWPQRAGDNYNVWRQSTNPVTEVTAVEGYEAVDVNFDESFWGGLENGHLHGGDTPRALLDGGVNEG